MVYENDTFELELGIDTKVTHKPLLTGDRGKPKLVYMVAHFTDGGHHFEWMSISDVDKIRGRSPSGKSGPWVTDYEQMALKTVIRRGWKFLPMSIEMQKTEIIEHAADTGKSLIIDGDSIEISPVQNDTEQETIADLAIDPQYMPKNSIDAIAAEMEKVTTESDLDKIQDTRVAPFTNKMRDEDIDRLNAVYESVLSRLNAKSSDDDMFPQ
jgi:recombination protein RecT